MAREGRSGRRYAVFGLVIFVHAVFVVLALRLDEKTSTQVKNASPLIFLNLAAPIQRENPVPPTKTSVSKQSSLVSPKRAQGTLFDFATRADTQPVPSSDAWPLGLGIDWHQEAQQVANSRAESIFKELKHLCEEAALRGEQPPGCRKYRRPDAWVPEPKKFGVSGGLPYVRLGKRCVLGLGFFGCGVGKLPEADGHVLDDMRDPDRPRSSVPDPNE